ncbi:class I SAM-dependent methyltransferase [Streptomyces asoensis]|uniref:Class I SAM-dependent methyltransferase n=1 Tax=Streptomyces asoensis TaxID=249586 RepID=A0A6M4WFL0_9ACTN|nr:class I SAM-dependent methyltransferase [Streptomyces asoensis]QJS99253.1 class I SAM-dependent methyltransferase [Streptomyces asoensis]
MPDTSYLSAVRESYDTVAADYAASVKPPAELDPVSRAMLAAFAELVRDSGRGPVADVGCGPGKVTAHLAGLGLSAFGVDVSPKMIELARKAHPDLRFTVGSMTALELGDHELGGILAYYSTHHTPPELLRVVFAEFHRTLAPGGYLMLVCRVGKGEHLSRTLAYGDHPAPFESYRLPADRISELLEQTGLVVTARLLQGPAEGTVGSFMVRRPE